MKFAFYTLGCKTNQYETQAMERLLAQQGHDIASFEDACDGYIINTCSVTAVADKKNRAVLRRCRREHPEAVIGVCGKLQSLMQVISQAMMDGSASMVGQSVGAGKQERVKRVVWDATLLGVAFAVIWILLFQLFPHQIFSIFSNDPAVIEMAPPFMTVCSINMLAAALMSPTMGLINGVGDTVYNMIVAIADGVAARLVLSLLLGFTAGMGALGFYLGNCLAGFVSVLGGGLYFLAGWWKKKGSLVRHE